MSGSRGHWEDVYTTKSEKAVSRYQPHALRSLELIEQSSPDGRASVTDVGGGASTLVDDLIGRGFTDLTVLDIAESAQAGRRREPGRSGMTAPSSTS